MFFLSKSCLANNWLISCNIKIQISELNPTFLKSDKSPVSSNFYYVLHSHFHVILNFFTPCLNWLTTRHLGCDSAN